jgi:WD40 repeat protein
VKIPTGGGNGIGGIAFSPDNKILAVQIADNFSYLDPASGNKLYESKDSKIYGQFAFSPDGSTLAIADVPYGERPSMHLWDVAAKKQRAAYPIDFGVCFLSYFPDGKAIVYRGGTLKGIKGGVRICDAESGAPLASLDIDNSEFSSVAVSPDGRTLAAGNDKAVVFLWDVCKLILKNEKIPAEFKPADLDALWQIMGGNDAPACRAKKPGAHRQAYRDTQQRERGAARGGAKRSHCIGRSG